MTVALIITTYNRPDALGLVLDSVLRQSVMPDEVIIADDGSGPATKELVEKYKSMFSVPLHHVWQEDKGFRAAKIRNEGIKKAGAQYIILIDGDIVLHKEFVKSHILMSGKNLFLQGHRAMLDAALTYKALKEKKINFGFWEKGIRNRKNTVHNWTLAKIFSRKSLSTKGIISCNFSFWRDDAYKVNGFNEDFTGWGKEDTEFGIRLLNAGLQRRDLRFCAVGYHLDHGNNNKHLQSPEYKRNLALLKETVTKKKKYCTNGLVKR